MTENNTGQSRSSQHRQPKKKASSPSNKKKILKKVCEKLARNEKSLYLCNRKTEIISSYT